MKLTRRLNLFLYAVPGSKDSRCLQAVRSDGQAAADKQQFPLLSTKNWARKITLLEKLPSVKGGVILTGTKNCQELAIQRLIYDISKKILTNFGLVSDSKARNV